MSAPTSLVLLRPEASLMRTVDRFRERFAAQIEPVPLIHGFTCRVEPPFAEALRDDPAVILVEADQAIMAQSSLPRRAVPEALARIRAPSAWSRSEGAGISVAVLDSGVDLTHPLLAPNLGTGINVIEPGRPPTDDSGHGTHIAGLIAAVRGRSPVIGVAPQARIHPVKILTRNGRGRLSDLIRGIGWAVEQRIPIINISAGVADPSDSLLRAVQAAVAAGALLVAAAGNGGGSLGYPAALPEAVAVAALDLQDHVAPFSASGQGVDIAAPGVAMLSTIPGGGVGRKSGTSFAAPLVAGGAALYLALHPAATPLEAKAALLASAAPLPGIPASQVGAGRLDLWNLVNYGA